MINYSRILSKTIFVATTILAGLSAVCFAQTDYPSRTIRIIVPLPPGP